MRPHPTRASRFQTHRRLCPTAPPVPSFGARSAGPSSRGFSETGMACTTAVRWVDWAAAVPQRQARRLAHTIHRDASASRAAAHAPWWPGDINKNKRFERRPKSVPRTNAQPFLYRGDTAAPPPPPRGARHAPTPCTGPAAPIAQGRRGRPVSLPKYSRRPLDRAEKSTPHGTSDDNGSTTTMPRASVITLPSSRGTEGLSPQLLRCTTHLQLWGRRGLRLRWVPNCGLAGSPAGGLRPVHPFSPKPPFSSFFPLRCSRRPGALDISQLPTTHPSPWWPSVRRRRRPFACLPSPFRASHRERRLAGTVALPHATRQNTGARTRVNVRRGTGAHIHAHPSRADRRSGCTRSARRGR